MSYPPPANAPASPAPAGGRRADGDPDLDRVDQRRIAIALAILGISLLLVVTLTVRATAAAWERSAWMQRVAEPARAATEEVEAALLTRMQGTEGLRATGAEEYGRQVERAVARERAAVAQLYSLAAEVNPRVSPAVRQLEVALDTAWIRAGGGEPGTAGWQAEFHAYHDALAAAQEVERVIVAETALRRQRAAAQEARASAGGLMMIPIAICCLWIALRCVVRLRAAARVARERRAELERLSQEKAALVYEVTRYLRQPLGTVAGRLATLEVSAGAGLDGGARAALAGASGELRRALQILHDLAELSTADAGSMPIRLGPVSLDGLLEGTASGLIGWASAKGVRLVLAPTPPEAAVLTDAERLRGILRNLLGSAIELASQGAVIQIEASLHSYRPDGAGGPWAALFISETPLEAPAAGRVSSLQQLKRQVGPSGELGLALSERVIALLGGSLWAYGGQPGGSRFALWLPAVTAAAGGGAPPGEVLPPAAVPLPG